MLRRTINQEVGIASWERMDEKGDIANGDRPYNPPPWMEDPIIPECDKLLFSISTF